MAFARGPLVFAWEEFPAMEEYLEYLLLVLKNTGLGEMVMG